MAPADASNAIGKVPSWPSFVSANAPPSHDPRSCASRSTSPSPSSSVSHSGRGVAAAPILDASHEEKGRIRNFERVSEYMCKSRDHEGMLFRRFDRANARGLMRMERDIAALEEELRSIEGRPVVDKKEVEDVEGELMAMMEEYYKTVLLTRDILALSRARKHSLQDVRRTFPPELNRGVTLLGKFYNTRLEDDLSCLGPASEKDVLTRALEKLGNATTVTHVVTFLSALCAVLFLVGAMVGLYFVSNMRARLGMVGMFTVLFAITIAGLTSSRRQEVFVATAAYAAVLVVFVGGNIANKPEPTICVLSGANGAAGSGVGAADAAAASNIVPQAVTVGGTPRTTPWVYLGP